MMFRDEECCLGQVVSVHHLKVEVGDLRGAFGGQRETAQLDEISSPIIRKQLFEVGRCAGNLDQVCCGRPDGQHSAQSFRNGPEVWAEGTMRGLAEVIEVKRNQAGDGQRSWAVDVTKHVGGLVQLFAIPDLGCGVEDVPAPCEPIEVLGDSSGVVPGCREGESALEKCVDRARVGDSVCDEASKLVLYTAKICFVSDSKVELVFSLRPVIAQSHFDYPLTGGQKTTDLIGIDVDSVQTCLRAVRKRPVRRIRPNLDQLPSVPARSSSEEQNGMSNGMCHEHVLPQCSERSEGCVAVGARQGRWCHGTRRSCVQLLMEVRISGRPMGQG
ncbi:hypothetical protein ACWDT5_22245 [Rhodococcus aetherivorans]